MVVAANKGQKPKDEYTRRNAFDVKIDNITAGRLGGRSPRNLWPVRPKTADRAQRKKNQIPIGPSVGLPPETMTVTIFFFFRCLRFLT